MNAANPELLRRYRLQLFTATWLSYCGFYLTRKVYAVVKHPLKEQFGLDDIQIAWPWTIYLITYMLGQFLAAWLGRRLESRGAGMRPIDRQDPVNSARRRTPASPSLPRKSSLRRSSRRT